MAKSAEKKAVNATVKKAAGKTSATLTAKRKGSAVSDLEDSDTNDAAKKRPKRLRKPSRRAKEAKEAEEDEDTGEDDTSDGSSTDDEDSDKVVEVDAGSIADGSEAPIEVDDDDVVSLKEAEVVALKGETTRDLDLFFTQSTKLKLKSPLDGSVTIEIGRWCTVCRDDLKAKGFKHRPRGWLVGGNSSLRRHIASRHYSLYQTRCKEADIKESKEAIPSKVRKAREAVAAAASKTTKTAVQSSLDGVVQKLAKIPEFNKWTVLDAVSTLIVVCNLPLALADEVAFTNVLVVMRPKTTREELLTTWTVRQNICNKFVEYISNIKAAIENTPGEVSVNWDLWTREHTSDPCFGITGQWIDVSPDGWKLRSEASSPK
ncbi:uncharacterized protein PHACADRAFT_189225 [Phanerochaete carnosa HHB-10118-sp]|uniref:BED-type domain-containing protein n=1 Tax=Phanerochaete carnosa (strain HHB-10118-sp) TaxID=650164 RepID=K5WDI4_PHACS|nr:uncharacterized protein PHACADRAFT_189225 [Phanerochaete carnosa HHB-10118-sp]EKM48237.1 hypothetical protein PHACADRAFT_189225 [Phanerochaete carnosa HHB-10118-sp]